MSLSIAMYEVISKISSKRPCVDADFAMEVIEFVYGLQVSDSAGRMFLQELSHDLDRFKKDHNLS